METRQKTREGTCPTHGSVQGVKEVPVFKAPGLFWAIKSLGTLSAPFRCPQCGSKVT